MLNNLFNPGVSVIIVTYNGKSRLTQTLNHLALQEGIAFPWEIILVDNNSNDGTAQVARNEWLNKIMDVPFSVILEKRPGTMYARYTGIVSSNFRYLLFVDDDNWLSENYVNTAYELIRKDEGIAALGGRGTMEFEKGYNPPYWVANYEMSYGCGPQGKHDGDTTFDQGWLYTAGAILDRVWLDRLYTAGFKSALTGRDGRNLAPGEDSELTYGLKIIGGRLHYSSSLSFKHFMPNNRITWDYLKKLWFATGQVDFTLLPYAAFWSRMGFLFYAKNLVSLGKNILLNVYFRIRTGSADGNHNTLMLLRHMGQLQSYFVRPNGFLKAYKTVRALSVK